MDPRNEQFYGVYPALVMDNVDPEGQGRVQVRLPWSEDENVQGIWARVATLMAGAERGTWFIPDVDDEVLVAFEAGDPRRPYVIGAMWNAGSPPPERMDAKGSNEVKSIVSRRGLRIALQDIEGEETIAIQTPGGQQFILKDGAGTVDLHDSSGNLIHMDSNGITISTPGALMINAPSIQVNCGKISINCPLSTFSGVVKADTLITNSVVSASYTPGAGNIW